MFPFSYRRHHPSFKQTLIEFGFIINYYYYTDLQGWPYGWEIWGPARVVMVVGFTVVKRQGVE